MSRIHTPSSYRALASARTRAAARWCPTAGFNVIELLMVVAVLGLILSLTLPGLMQYSARLRVSLAAGEVASALRQARIYSIRNSKKVAVKFRTAADRSVTMTLYGDGDGDGVRNLDIDSGTDPIQRQPMRLAHFGLVGFGFPDGEAPYEIGKRRRMSRLEDPIRFNQSDLASFDRQGTATPGTVYLSDYGRYLAAVRVTNTSGKITIWMYDRKVERWRRHG